MKEPAMVEMALQPVDQLNGEVSLPLKQCFSLKMLVEKNIKFGLGTSMMAIFLMPLAMAPCGTKKMIWTPEFAPQTTTLKPNLGLDVVMPIAMEKSHVLDVNFEIES